MKIEFKKVPTTTKNLVVQLDSVKIEGTFCKISQSLVKIDGKLNGTININCCRCGKEELLEVNENIDFLLSDGIYKNNESEEVVIKIENSLIDFDDIIKSELNSLKSDYYTCIDCLQDNTNFEKEF